MRVLLQQHPCFFLHAAKTYNPLLEADGEPDTVMEEAAEEVDEEAALQDILAKLNSSTNKIDEELVVKAKKFFNRKENISKNHAVAFLEKFLMPALADPASHHLHSLGEKIIFASSNRQVIQSCDYQTNDILLSYCVNRRTSGPSRSAHQPLNDSLSSLFDVLSKRFFLWALLLQVSLSSAGGAAVGRRAGGEGPARRGGTALPAGRVEPFAPRAALPRLRAARRGGGRRRSARPGRRLPPLPGPLRPADAAQPEPDPLERRRPGPTAPGRALPRSSAR